MANNFKNINRFCAVFQFKIFNSNLTNLKDYNRLRYELKSKHK